MSSTAFKLDIGDPQTIADFVERVQSPERLKLLLVLTVADIRAVGPKVWNGWKAALLRELYHRAIEVISGGLSGEGQDLAQRAHSPRRAGFCPISAMQNLPTFVESRLSVLLAFLRSCYACPACPLNA